MLYEHAIATMHPDHRTEWKSEFPEFDWHLIEDGKMWYVRQIFIDKELPEISPNSVMLGVLPVAGPYSKSWVVATEMVGIEEALDRTIEVYNGITGG